MIAGPIDIPPVFFWVAIDAWPRHVSRIPSCLFTKQTLHQADLNAWALGKLHRPQCWKRLTANAKPKFVATRFPNYELEALNAGFQLAMLAHRSKGMAAVVVTNDDNGGPLIDKILVIIENTEHWPGF